MSVGVLVRRNKDANEVADYLRENSAFPVHTGSAVKPAEDNAAGAALLAMLRHAAHPSDQLAAGFLQLIDASTSADSLLAATNELRTRLLRDNHESAVRWACQRILTKLTAQDTRHRTRLNQLIEKARAFDSEDSRDLDALYRYLQNSSSGDCAPGDAVIVETIHKSKGLEYDIVILVNEDKGGGPGDRRISALLDSQGKAQWILEPIKKDLMAADPELSRLQAQSESQQDFGNLCTLYVGMTRAKRALYMISDFSRVSKRSSVHYLRQCLGDEADSEGLIWATGDTDWHQSFKTKARKSTPPEQPPIHPKFEPAHPRLQLQRPSSDKHTRLKASTLFDYQANAAEFGTQVHDAFEQIAWLEATSPIDPLLHECFANPDIQALFTQPTQAVELWREKAFSYVEGEQFINGVFDRVHIYKDASGKITQAEIIDYKTDRIREGTTIAQAAEKHRPQLQAYAKALGKITGLTKEQIQLTLIFTHTSQLQQL
ncbi:3'-5' exonuclease [Coraliomargarita algicola]|uniref:DNA 3'-5' helicase II n=1 Tax=Coraliomargarita algicola TaxID=3092156 RepID=A0ABZ0RLL0_9BACT|nr:3'-5' exonuclease [Coraliomargarita sp. J2-16]WPJ96036.1 3'-5' exonuclease [Coraliomargarita sp. J2-16]